MGILAFLFGLGCLVVVVWVIALVTDAVFGRKHRQQQNRPQEQPSPKSTQFREHKISQPITIVPSVPPRIVVALRQPPVSSRVRLHSSRHQQYIRLADSVLEQVLKR